MAPAARNAASMMSTLPLTNAAIMARKAIVAYRARSNLKGRESSTSLIR